MRYLIAAAMIAFAPIAQACDGAYFGTNGLALAFTGSEADGVQELFIGPAEITNYEVCDFDTPVNGVAQVYCEAGVETATFSELDGDSACAVVFRGVTYFRSNTIGN